MRDITTKDIFHTELNKCLLSIEDRKHTTISYKQPMQIYKASMNNTTETQLSRTQGNGENNWMTMEILEFMDERRRYKLIYIGIQPIEQFNKN